MALNVNWQAMNDEEFARLLRNAEGKNTLERSMFLEAARRIEEKSVTQIETTQD